MTMNISTFLSRGIPPAAAQRLIVAGFLNEVVERLPDRAIRERLRGIDRGEVFRRLE